MTSPNRPVTLLPATVITTNATTTGTAVTGLAGVTYVAFESILTVGSGGGTCNVYLQTSLDGGATWFDIANHSFTTSTASKVSAMKANIATSAAVTPGDGSLTGNSIVDGLLGDRFRVKVVTAGTAYAGGSTIAVSAVFKGNPG